jgi:hypothetical protein
MSLVGSLEDLGLGDILQIVSLSRKSGALTLRSEAGDGCIVLCEGLVRGAAIKGEPESLRALLVAEDLLTDDDFERVTALVDERGVSLDDAVAEVADMDLEQIESLRRGHVERAAMRMFSWRSGEFSFEVREEIEAENNQLLLATGISTQFLTMEATRLRDESAQPTALPEPAAGDDDSDEEPVFSGESEETEVAEDEEGAVHALALATAKNADAPAEDAPTDEWETTAAAEPDAPAAPPEVDTTSSAEEDETAESAEISEAPDDADAATSVPDEGADVAEEDPRDGGEPSDVAIASESTEPTPVDVSMEPAAEPSPAPAAPSSHPAFNHLVAIDPNLAGLEWFKASIDGMFERVHIFQRSEIGVDRIRHYLGRGIVPVVVISPRATGDPMTCVRDVQELIGRLRSLAPKIPVLALSETGAAEPQLRGIDRIVCRPASPGSDPDDWARFEDIARRLREELAPWSDGTSPPAAVSPAQSAAAGADLGRLKEVSDRLRDPSTQGEVLSLVLDFAAECFSRVAIFMIRDHLAAGMAQREMVAAGGPDDEELRKIEFDRESVPELFRSAVERCTSVRSTMDEEGDRRLAMLLGTEIPSEAYAAPIESGGCVVALLYADNLPGKRSMPDTAGLEIVLHEAGLALDRALLQRTLASANGG